MNPVRISLTSLFAALILLLAACGQHSPTPEEANLSLAATTTIDFGTLDDDFAPYTEDGFTLRAVLNGGDTGVGFVRVTDIVSPGNSFASPNFGFDGQDIILTNDAALPFSLSSLDLLEATVFPSPRTFTVQGTRTDSTVVEQTFTTDGVAGRETFLLSNFTNLASVRLGSGASTDAVAVDNLILEVGAADTTPPVITLTTPGEGAKYLLGQAVNANYSCSDNTAIASCVGTVANGAAINTASVGSKSFKVDAADTAGNTASKSVNYQVIYKFGGFLQPVDAMPTLNQVNAGRSIPIKFSLSGNQGLNIFASGSPSSQPIACDASTPSDDIEQTVTASNSTLTYDPTTDIYTYVWKTEKGWAGTCRQLSVKLSDGMTYTANFKFK